jgi:hypothetical protein
MPLLFSALSAVRAHSIYLVSVSEVAWGCLCQIAHIPGWSGLTNDVLGADRFPSWNRLSPCVLSTANFATHFEGCIRRPTIGHVVHRSATATESIRRERQHGSFFGRLDFTFEIGLKRQMLSDTQIFILLFSEMDSDTPLNHIQGSRSILVMSAHPRTRFHNNEDSAETRVLEQCLRVSPGAGWGKRSYPDCGHSDAQCDLYGSDAQLRQ